MVRVWLRPALAALTRRIPSQTATLAVRARVVNAVAVQTDSVFSMRAFSTKKDKKGLDKKPIAFEDEEDLTEIPPEVQYLGSQELEITDDDDEDEEFELDLEDDEDDDDDDDEEFDGTPEEWAEQFEREVAEWDGEDGENEGAELEDDRLYVEMPGYDTSLSLATQDVLEDDDNAGRDPFRDWEQGVAATPEMLNWMLPADKRRPFSKGQEKPWQYFVKANHPDVVELALDVELLRLFISPTGRIRPRRFTGLTAKQQRKLAQAVKISRQLALLPYLSRYPEPSPEQWKAMEEEEIAKSMAEMDADDDDDDDDDDVDFDEDFEYE